jgi:Flp pilus assembly pilin Flp
MPTPNIPLHAEPHPQPSSLPQRPNPTHHALTHDERGTSTVEYLILLVLVAVIAITAWTEIGGALIEKIRYATDAIASLGG